MSPEDLAARLTAIFLGELQEQLRGMNRDLLALESDPDATERLRSLFRSAHTLKGAARAAGIGEIEGACHAMESLLAQARDGRVSLGEREFAWLFAAVDALTDAEERLRSGRSLTGTPVAALARGGSPASPEAAAVPKPPARKAAPAAASVPDDFPGARVRLEPEKLDAVLSSASELLVTTGRLADRPARARELEERAGRCLLEWRRLERRVRPGLRDGPSRRAAADFTAALEGLAREVGGLAAEAGEEARLLTRLAGDLGERMHRLRMRPFADACEGLPRMVRDLATAEEKEVRLRVTGGEVEADRIVLDAVREALIHLIRNAVDHGIEAPEVRERAGKDRAGTVTIHAELRGDRLVVDLQDDGGGLDLVAIRRQLERRGRTLPDAPDALVQALFEGGLSTRAEPSPISGRGVGLNAVRAATDRIRGRARVAWEAGRWTRFTLECPLTLAAVRALLVGIGDQVLAFPTSDVERLVRVVPDQVRRVQGRDVLTDDEGPVPLVSLARLLGPPLEARVATGPIQIVRLRSGRARLAVAVDELVAEQELIVRPLHAARGPAYLIGGALLGTGHVALVLDAAAVIASGLGEGAAGAIIERAAPAGPERRTIVLADDSITTRALEQSILESAGFRVLAAADGEEAWRLVQQHPCDLVVSDVEMPRMDGFELCRAIRGSHRLAGLPVVLVTALETAEDRGRGLEAGADAYITKSSFDQRELLATIDRLTGREP